VSNALFLQLYLKEKVDEIYPFFVAIGVIGNLSEIDNNNYTFIYFTLDGPEIDSNQASDYSESSWNT